MDMTLTSNKAKLSLNVCSLFEYILGIFLVLNCNTVYDRLANTNLHFDYILAFLSIFLMLFYCRKVDWKVVEFLVFAYAVTIFYFVGAFFISEKSDFVLQFFVFFPCMVIYLVGCAKQGRILDLYQKITNVIFILALVSTIVWFFTEIIPIFSLNTNVTISWGTDHTVRGVFGLYFQCQKEITFGFSLYRNTGIFCEAPMHSLVLSFALIYELFLSKTFSLNKIIILSIIMLTTFSSTGILFLLVAFAIKYWQHIGRTRNRWKVIYIVGLIIVIPILYLIVYQLLDTKSSTNSFNIRWIDYITGLIAWQNHPIFGVGYNNIIALYEYKYALMSHFGVSSGGTGFSNSITGILAQGGLILSLFYLIPFVAVGFRARNYGNINYRYFVILIMFLFIFTIFHARFIMIFFIALCYSIILVRPRSKQRDIIH